MTEPGEADRAALRAARVAAARRDPEYADLTGAPADGGHAPEGASPRAVAEADLRGTQAEGVVVGWFSAADGGAFAALARDGGACVLRLCPGAAADLARVYDAEPRGGEYLAADYLRREGAFVLDERRTRAFSGGQRRAIVIRGADEREMEF